MLLGRLFWRKKDELGFIRTNNNHNFNLSVDLVGKKRSKEIRKKSKEKKMTEKETKVKMGMEEQGKFTKFMKERVFPNGIVIIALIVAWISGFIFRGIYR